MKSITTSGWGSLPQAFPFACIFFTLLMVFPWVASAQSGVSFTGLNGPYCASAAPVTLTGSQAPAGTFSGPGITDHGDGTATFNPATAGTGGTIKYTAIGDTWASVSAGSFHTLAVKPDGTLWAWASNYYGELGIGNNDNQNSPVQVGTDNNWASVSAGHAHTLAIKTDGTLWAWGRNNNGQLGIGNNTAQNSPVQVGTDNNWMSVSAGFSHTLAIKTDGTLWAWGNNEYGQLGIGNTDNQYSPVKVGTDDHWTSVSAGEYHTLAIKSDGSLWVWGGNSFGSLGTFHSNGETSPVPLSMGGTWVNVSASTSFSLAIRTDGTLWAWGYNQQGQLGLGDNSFQSPPTQVGDDDNWAQVEGGSSHTLARKTDGSLWAWGVNPQGQLGIGNNDNQNSPVRVGAASNWTNISAGAGHSFGVQTGGSLWSWGNNSNGELGIGNNDNQVSPVQLETVATLVTASQAVTIDVVNAGILASTTALTCDITVVTATASGGNSYLWSGGTSTNTADNTFTEPGTYTVTVTNANNCQATASVTLSRVCFTGLGGPYCASDAPVTLTGSLAPAGTFSGPGITDHGDGTATFNPATAIAGGDVVYTAPLTEPWTSISAGVGFTMAIKPDGTLWAWGANDNGQLGVGSGIYPLRPKQVGTDNNWASVSAGSYHTLAIKTDGTLWAWGNNNYGQLGLDNNNTSSSTPVQVGSDNNWMSASAGSSHSLAIKSDGTLWAWGANNLGQLGLGDNSDRHSPVQVGFDNNWALLETGSDHTLAIKSDGTLWTWGYNLSGQLGTGDTGDRNSPVQVGSANNWASVSPSAYYTLGVKTDGTLWAWGNNVYGQLGTGNNNGQYSPTQVDMENTWATVSVGAFHTLATKTDGTLWAWGYNGYDQLGIGNNNHQTSPVRVGSDNNWIKASAGDYHSLGIQLNGLLWVWGNNGNGQLGTGNYDTQSNPTHLFSLVSASQQVTVYPASAGISLSPSTLTCENPVVIATASGGNSYQWSGGTSANTAINTFTEPGTYTVTVTTANNCQSTASVTLSRVCFTGLEGLYCATDAPVTLTGSQAPAGTFSGPGITDHSDGTATFNPATAGAGGAVVYQVPLMEPWTSISAGGGQSFGIKPDGTLWAWGFNFDGQLGNGTTNSSNIPAQVGTDNNWASVSAGSYHTLAIKTDGTLWAWGYNEYGQLGLDHTNNSSTPVQVGSGNNWMSVSAGSAHSLAIKTDGTLWAWGSNYNGQLGTGDNGNRYSPVQVGYDNNWALLETGYYNTLAIKTDGTLWAWGYNSDGQLGFGYGGGDQYIPSQVGSANNWASVSPSAYHTLGVKTDGTLWAWGYNGYGQLGTGDYSSSSTPIRVGTETTWANVSVGESHTLATKTDGTLWAWGYNGYGQLGIGNNSGQNSPVRVGTDNNWAKASAGTNHSLGIQLDGLLRAWGYNSNGQLGIGNNGSQSNPTPVSRLVTTSQQVAIHTARITNNTGTNVLTCTLTTIEVTAAGGISYEWSGGSSQSTANNSFTEPGTYTVTVTTANYCQATASVTLLRVCFTGLDNVYCDNAAPVTLIGTQTPVGVFSGPGITDHGDGTATFNPAAAGNGGTVKYSVTMDEPWVSESCGLWHTLAIKPDGTLWAWGYNANGELGIGNITNQNIPVQVGTDNNWASISTGSFHSLAIKTDGTLWAWGDNTAGQLGTGDGTGYQFPKQVGTDNNWVSVKCGEYFSLAIKSDGTLWAWGYNEFGQLGLGYTDNEYSPVQVGTDNTWLSISGGTTHTLALKADGTLWAWGDNSAGQLGIGTYDSQYLPVQVNTDIWTNITAGELFSLAIKPDGSLWSWGFNGNGQLGIGTTDIQNTPIQVNATNDWVSISAGYGHSMALNTNGELWTWGRNDFGNLGIGNTETQYIPVQVGTDADWASVHAGGSHSLAQKTDGSIWAWGRNSTGQLGIANNTNQSSPAKVPTIVTISQEVTIPVASIENTTGTTILTCTTTAIEVTATVPTINPASNITCNWSGGTSPNTAHNTLIEPGSYTVTITSDYNCTSILSITISRVCFTGLGTEYCANDAPVTLTGSLAPAGTFSGPGITDNGNGTATFDPAAAGAGGYIEYTATVDENGTAVSVTTSLPVLVNPFPAITNNTGTNVLTCTTTAIEVTAKCGISYQWSGGASLNTANNSFAEPGTYTVTITDSNNSTASQTITIAQVCFTGLASPYCANDPSVTLTGSLAPSGTFSGPGITDNGDGTATFDPATAGTGGSIVYTAVIGDTWTSISGGEGHTLAIKTDGTLWAWGGNNYGRLGIGNLEDHNSPVQVGNDNHWASLSAGAYHSIGIKTDGTLWAWGNNDEGQLGIGNYDSQSIPVQVGADDNWISAATGYYFTVALKADGTLWAWGNNSFGQLGLGHLISESSPVKIGIESDWAKVDAGGGYTLAIKLDGTLWAWGLNGDGALGIGNYTNQNSPVRVGADNGWSHISTGYNTTFAKKTNGSLWAWGANWSGQLGVGDSDSHNSPVQIGTDYDWATLQGGNEHTIARKTDGSLWAWGINWGGQLGIGNTDYQITPVQIGSDHNWLKVSTGDYHSMGIKTDGSLWTWGYNGHGELGIGNNTDQYSPVSLGTVITTSQTVVVNTFPSITNQTGTTILTCNVTEIAVTANCGIGYAWSGGTSPTTASNSFTEPGTYTVTITNNNNQTATQSITISRVCFTGLASTYCATDAPVTLTGSQAPSGTFSGPGITDNGNGTATFDPAAAGGGGEITYTAVLADSWASVSTGEVHTLGIQPDGTLWAWGVNLFGQLGIGNTNNASIPVQVGMDHNWAKVSTGSSHTLAIKTDGTLWAWGLNVYGQLGNGNNNNVNSPVQVGMDNDWTNVSAGVYHSLARKADGTIWSWGWNGLGQLGIGNTDNQNSPVQVGGDSDWATIAINSSHSMAIKTDGTLWAWGFNNNGQLGIGNNDNQNSPVKLGTDNTWVSVEAGVQHTLAIKTDGTLWAWGLNNNGQLGIGNNNNQNSPIQVGTATDWMSTSASSFHTTAIKTDGTLWAWGLNNNGQLGTGNNNNSNSPVQVGTDNQWTQISTGNAFSFGIKSNAGLWAWGFNIIGQLGLGNTDAQRSPIALGTSVTTSQTVTITSACAPTITAFTPASGCPGSSITITGTQLSGAISVKIGGTEVRSIDSKTDTEIKVTVGSGTTGAIVVTTSQGAATSATAFTVNTAASIGCPTSSVEVSTDPNQCNAVVNYDVTADGTPAPTLTYARSVAVMDNGNGTGSGLTFPLGTTLVTVKATNLCSAPTCTFNVVVTDAQKPTITCPVNQAVPTAPDNCSTPPVTYSVTTTDNCSSTVSLVSGPSSGSVFPLGLNTVVWKATDPSGNSTTCAFTVTVGDGQNPSIVCPPSISKNTDPSQCTAITTYATPTVSDNCTGWALTRTGLASGSAFPKGVNMVQWQVSDVGGNVAVCQFTVTVTDNRAPVITCPANLVRGNSAGQCYAVVAYATPTATDNCGAVTVARTSADNTASGSQFPKGVTTVTWAATDNASPANTATCSFTVTVNDTQAPTVTCPANQTKPADAGLCTAVTNYTTPTFTDNCTGGSVSIVSGLASGQPFPKGINTVQWKATDGAGLTKTCTFRITVSDTQAPTISCPASQSLSTDAGLCSAVAAYATPTASDNCTPPPTVVRASGLASGSAFPKGTSTVVWKATDGVSLTKTCSFTVTVTDAQLPTVTCPANITATGSGSPCVATVTYTSPTATDNCTVQSVFLQSGPSSGSQFPAGVTAVMWRAVDNSGGSSTCSFTVTVGCGTSPSQPPRWGGAVTAERDVVSDAVTPPHLGGRVGPSPVGLLLSPNPATAEVQVVVENLGETGGEVTVTDAQGRTVWQRRVGQDALTGGGQVTVTLDVSGEKFAAGLYFVTLRSEGGTVTKRLVVQRL